MVTISVERDTSGLEDVSMGWFGWASRPVLQLATVTTLLLTPLPSLAGTTLQNIVERDYLVCGIDASAAGFAEADADGLWSGFDVDYCRAVAAAIFGTGSKVRFRSVGVIEGLAALTNKEVDVLSRAVSWSAHLEAGLGLRFVGVSFFSGQGLLVRRDLGVASALELSGIKICVGGLPDVETNVVDYFTSRDMTFEIVPFDRDEEASSAYDKGKCDAYSADVPRLAAVRRSLAKPTDHQILSDDLSREPLGPVVRKGDDQWFDVNRWTLNALIAAEEMGVTAENAGTLAASGTSAVKHLLGTEGGIGEQLGIRKSWGFDIIREVGNYGELFERNLGVAKGLGLERHHNQLWSRGGLIFAPALF